MKTTARTMGLTILAGMMTLGMTACTQVESGTSKATSAAAEGASSAASAVSSAAGEATSAAASATSQASTPQQSSSATATASSDTSSTETSSGDASGPKVGRVGEEVKTAQMSAKVNKIADPITSESDYDKPASGKHFVAVNVTMTNLGSEDLNAGATCLKVKLDDNTSAKEDYASYGQRLDYGTLYKGDTTTGDVVYEVPNGKKIKTIDVKCGYGDEQAIRIQAK